MGMPVRITKTTRNRLKSGIIKGTIGVISEGRRYTVQYERAPNGHSEQWGAPTEVLCKTYHTFERLCTATS